MILKIFGSYFTSDNQLATGTYPDGLYPVLAAKELANERDRNFRESYARDYSLARTMDHQPPGFA
ncbi:hypothetical protein LH464_12375 [Neorhizobium sp. T786]|uniref:hypothetical protein n=1 Tax=Pseudorhizobium xiangyangii TaxID=2883104 RepID=UPI001CFFF69B|nr:hypothetical protein [Neorhizobium xiangyangii]MCB5203266.1 hypothetical protein [Neorhizobium xiangyangii]